MEGGGGGEGKGRVCVTGGTGFVASWLIKRLLEHGYFVNTTVRSYKPGGEKDVSYLINLPSASEKLKIFNADLDKPESYEEPIKGCIGVFHVAHPIDLEGNEAEVVLNQRAIKAMLGILQICIDSKTVKKVVYTSSDATMVYPGTELDVIDESSWSDVDFIRESQKFGATYSISKTLTEKAGLEFAEKHGLKFVTINPSFIHGPFITPNCPPAVRMLLAMMLGNGDLYDSCNKVLCVHVDDVVSAHIFLFENPEVKGRYLCSQQYMNKNKLAEYLSIRYPEFKIRMDFGSADTKGHEYPLLSSRKLFETGFKYKYSLEDTYDEAIQCCKEKGIL